MPVFFTFCGSFSTASIPRERGHHNTTDEDEDEVSQGLGLNHVSIFHMTESSENQSIIFKINRP